MIVPKRNNVLQGNWPMLINLNVDQSPPTDIVVPVTGNFVAILSDIILGGVAIFLAGAHFLGWFLVSPYPIAFAATVGALGTPFLVWLRVSDAWHRRRLSKFLADEAERKQQS